MRKVSSESTLLSDNLRAYRVTTADGHTFKDTRWITLEDLEDSECVMIQPDELDTVISFLQRVRDWLLEEEK